MLSSPPPGIAAAPSPHPEDPQLTPGGSAPGACSIVIRSFNEERSIGRLLTGISKQSVRDVEVILVDSGSTDATVAIASQFPVRVLHIAPEQFSFGRSLNLGCAAATRELIVLASAHVYPVYDDWLAELLSPFRDAGVCLSYGKQRGGHTTKYSEHQIFSRWFPETSVARQRHSFCNNANAAIRRAQWLRQPYDEELTGLEDLAWADAAMQGGQHIAYSAQAEVVHVHDERPSNIYNRYRREALAYRRIHPEQSFGVLDCARLAAANMASDYFHAWHDGELRANLLEIPVFRACQFFGAYRGFTQHEPPSSSLKQTFYYPRGFAKRSAEVETQAQVSQRREAIDYSSVGEPRSSGRR